MSEVHHNADTVAVEGKCHFYCYLSACLFIYSLQVSN